MCERGYGDDRCDGEEKGIVDENVEYILLLKSNLSRRAGRAYQELKGELGLDHVEGRSFPGWHHHVSVVRRGYAFIVAERVLRFSPSTGRQADDSTLPVAA